MAHKDKRVQVFLEELAAASATPGGGSAAALAGAMGAGLVCMVCRLTIGRKRFADVEDELRAALEEAETLRVHLIELADALGLTPEARAAHPLMDALSQLDYPRAALLLDQMQPDPRQDNEKAAT